MNCPTRAEGPGAEATLKYKWRAQLFNHGKGEKQRCASCPQTTPRISWNNWNGTIKLESLGWREKLAFWGCAGGWGQEEKAVKSKQASRGNTLHSTWNILGPKPLLPGLYLPERSWILAVGSAVTWHKTIADRHSCFPVGMRGRKLCLITQKIQPEMLAARGTNDSLQKNAWIQSSKHALTEECCLELPRMAAQQSGCTATPSQQALPGLESGLRQKGVGHCQKAGSCYRSCVCCCGNKAGSVFGCRHKYRLFQDGLGERLLCDTRG